MFAEKRRLVLAPGQVVGLIGGRLEVVELEGLVGRAPRVYEVEACCRCRTTSSWVLEMKTALVGVCRLLIDEPTAVREGNVGLADDGGSEVVLEVEPPVRQQGTDTHLSLTPCLKLRASTWWPCDLCKANLKLT